jgi:hypothetical protein
MACVDVHALDLWSELIMTRRFMSFAIHLNAMRDHGDPST